MVVSIRVTRAFIPIPYLLLSIEQSSKMINKMPHLAVAVHFISALIKWG